ncbi:hypothetical protein [Hansschlegelia sp. KR7-227]|jgi:hypothetical protein|uniref:hypothetical protein n=1 Tax=Hansschlegelia sp. KR7-227 TaxID=3400914 RepID=UPI003C003EB6
MGMIEIVVALCLQAEPSSCRISRERHPGAMTACVQSSAGDALSEPGWYRARYSCRWRT